MKKFEDEMFMENPGDILSTHKIDMNKEFKELDNEMFDLNEKIDYMLRASEKSARNVYLD
jgi:hypothetical protein